jgi:hypothetical protein
VSDAPARPKIDSYRLDLPAGWLEVPIGATSIREAMDAARAATPERWGRLTKAEQRRADLFVEQFISDLDAAGVSLAAIYREVVGDFDDEAGEPAAADLVDTEQDDSEQVDSLLAATVTVASVQPGITETSAPIDADLLLSALSLQKPVTDEDRARIGVNLEPPQIVELPAGRAVFTVRLIEPGAAVPVGTTNLLTNLKLFSASYYVPVPDDTRSVTLVQFSTPNQADAREFAELFGEIIKSLRFYAEGEPTTL